jgi:hypothetical protein
MTESVPLLEHVKTLIDTVKSDVDGFKGQVKQAQEFSKDAMLRADGVLKHNQEISNEWGRTFRELGQTYAPQSVINSLRADIQRIELAQKDAVKRDDLTKIYQDIEKLRDANSARTGQSQLVVLGISVIAVIIAGASLFTGHNAAVAPVAIVAPVAPVAPVLPLAPVK